MTRSQRWSKAALERVAAQGGQPSASRYRTLCMKMPGLVQQAGLVQALVFMMAREEGGDDFVQHLAEVHGSQNAKTLLQRVQGAGLGEYIALTHEVAQVSLWFRRFAQIELEARGEKTRSARAAT